MTTVNEKVASLGQPDRSAATAAPPTARQRPCSPAVTPLVAMQRESAPAELSGSAGGGDPAGTAAAATEGCRCRQRLLSRCPGVRLSVCLSAGAGGRVRCSALPPLVPTWPPVTHCAGIQTCPRPQRTDDLTKPWLQPHRYTAGPSQCDPPLVCVVRSLHSATYAPYV